jgi:tripeptidyl-peptidase II
MRVGFVQVESMWQHLTKISTRASFDVEYEVTSPDRGNARGIYVRSREESYSNFESAISVQPRFMDQKNPDTFESQLKLDIKITLKPTHDWIEAPEYVMLNNGGRGFHVKVKAELLEPGFHFGQVQAFDSEDMESGPLFNIPVTICKPQLLETGVSEAASTYTWNSLEFDAGTIQRIFVDVPMGANFAGMY